MHLNNILAQYFPIFYEVIKDILNKMGFTVR